MKLIILDRDGTINADRDDYVKSAEEWVPLPGALGAIARLNQGGWHTVVATNQSGLGRGLFDMAALNAMHLKMNNLLQKHGGRIDAVFFCPHTPDEHCSCRKPRPGLIELIGERYGIDLSQVPVVGDSLRDIQAAAAAGCEPHLLCGTKLGQLDPEQWAQVQQAVPGTQVHTDLSAFAQVLIQREREQHPSVGETDSGYRGE